MNEKIVKCAKIMCAGLFTCAILGGVVGCSNSTKVNQRSKQLNNYSYVSNFDKISNSDSKIFDTSSDVDEGLAFYHGSLRPYNNSDASDDPNMYYQDKGNDIIITEGENTSAQNQSDSDTDNTMTFKVSKKEKSNKLKKDGWKIKLTPIKVKCKKYNSGIPKRVSKSDKKALTITMYENKKMS